MTDEKQPDLTQATRITMQTYEQIAAGYARRHSVTNRPTFWDEIHERFVKEIQTSPGWLVDRTLPILDAGCGPGRDALLFAQQGFYVEAVDLSESMLEQARLHCANMLAIGRMALRQMDMRRLELPDASCAGAWVSASFLHIPKQENRAVLAELVRVLAPGGPLALLVKGADEGPDERYDPAPENNAPRFFARYHGGELWELLEQAGLRVILLAAWDNANNFPWLGALAVKRK
jgi:ubiquinone/menaquinone biosynthesis C-methylase UbiE